MTQLGTLLSVTTEPAQTEPLHPSLIELPGLEASAPSEHAQDSELSVVTTVRERPRWTLTEAAERVGVSRSTLRRRLEAGAFPHAKQVGEGDNPPWTVTVEDLLGAGFTLAKPVTEAAPKGTPTQKESAFRGRAQVSAEPVREQAHDLAVRVAELERELVQERARREVEHAQRTAAEALAHEREQHVQSLRQALRMLEARPAPAQPATDDPEPAPVEASQTSAPSPAPAATHAQGVAPIHAGTGTSPRAPQRAGFLGRLLGRRP